MIFYLRLQLVEGNPINPHLYCSVRVPILSMIRTQDRPHCDRLLKPPLRRKCRLRKSLMLFHRTQETEVVLRTTKEEDAPTDQTSAKKDSALSYDKEGFALDLTNSSDNIAEVRQS